MTLIHEDFEDGTGTPVLALANPPQPLTIMAWVRPTALPGVTPLFGWWSDTTPAALTGFAVYAQRSDFGTPGVLQGNVRIGGTLQVVTGPPLVLGERVHLALSYDGAAARLHVDGALVGTQALAGAVDIFSTLNTSTQNAEIEDLQVHNVALSAAEIVDIIAPPAPEPEVLVQRPAAFPMIEKALRELITAKMEDAPRERIGGDLSYTADDEFYIFIGLVGGSTDEINGEWSLDVDVFDSHYTQAMDRALALEAILLKRGGHVTSIMRLDNVFQNEIPISRPWDDVNAYRVGATYTFTARRSG